MISSFPRFPPSAFFSISSSSSSYIFCSPFPLKVSAELAKGMLLLLLLLSITFQDAFVKAVINVAIEVIVVAAALT